MLKLHFQMFFILIGQLHFLITSLVIEWASSYVLKGAILGERWLLEQIRTNFCFYPKFIFLFFEPLDLIDTVNLHWINNKLFLQTSVIQLKSQFFLIKRRSNFRQLLRFDSFAIECQLRIVIHAQIIKR